jgi:Zn-finger nucleic acid-binding protein
MDRHLTQFHHRIALELKQKIANRDYCLSQRTCAKCGDFFLQIEVDGVTLEYCRDCHCWWFDSAELMHFTESFEDISDGDYVDRVSILPCPVCKEPMHEQQLRVNSNLLVHVCPQQHGVFLEDGEFERALELSDRVDGLAGHLNDQHLAFWRQLQARLSAGEFDTSEITCVECGDNAVVVSIDGVDVDYCTQCQSCWFDSTELRHFTRQPRDVPGDYLTSRASTRICPKCPLHLRLYQFQPKSNVMVEACPGGHGVYLHSGEFPLVLKASEDVQRKICQKPDSLDNNDLSIRGVCWATGQPPAM